MERRNWFGPDSPSPFDVDKAMSVMFMFQRRCRLSIEIDASCGHALAGCTATLYPATLRNRVLKAIFPCCYCWPLPQHTRQTKPREAHSSTVHPRSASSANAAQSVHTALSNATGKTSTFRYTLTMTPQNAADKTHHSYKMNMRCFVEPAKQQTLHNLSSSAMPL